MRGDKPLQLIEASVGPACEGGADLGLQGVVAREDRGGLLHLASIEEVGGA